jgi:long-chain alkane monooxygenase
MPAARKRRSVRAGAQVPANDPMLVISAMAHVTEHLGFGVTASMSYEHPFIFARRMSTLDHLTNGRIGWNIVTSYLNSGARNVGLDAQIRHDDRYDIADEYLEVVYKLWDGSWDDDAVVLDRAHGIYADPAKVHPIKHEGKYFKVPGIHVAEPSLQRTPLLYQAGACSRGRRFAAKHAEAIFITEPKAEIVARRIADVRALAAAAGRDPYDIKVFSGYGVITGETRAEARRKYDLYRSMTDPEGTLALWSGWLGFDLAPYDHIVERRRTLILGIANDVTAVARGRKKPMQGRSHLTDLGVRLVPCAIGPSIARHDTIAARSGGSDTSWPSSRSFAACLRGLLRLADPSRIIAD